MTIAYTPLTEIEKAIVAKVAGATFPPSSAFKRFIQDLSSGYISRLSDRGRAFLALIAYRFRRQYFLSAEEHDWVTHYLAEPPPHSAGLADRR